MNRISFLTYLEMATDICVERGEGVEKEVSECTKLYDDF